jgi:hypothetical protein
VIVGDDLLDDDGDLLDGGDVGELRLAVPTERVKCEGELLSIVLCFAIGKSGLKGEDWLCLMRMGSIL